MNGTEACNILFKHEYIKSLRNLFCLIFDLERLSYTSGKVMQGTKFLCISLNASFLNSPLAKMPANWSNLTDSRETFLPYLLYLCRKLTSFFDLPLCTGFENFSLPTPFTLFCSTDYTRLPTYIYGIFLDFVLDKSFININLYIW